MPHYLDDFRTSVSDPFYSVSNNKSKSREDAKAQRNDYHVSVFLRVFASSRENIFLSVRALMAVDALPGQKCDREKSTLYSYSFLVLC